MSMNPLLRLLAMPVLLLLGGAVSAADPVAADPNGLWQDRNPAEVSDRGERWVVPHTYRLVALDLAALESHVRRAPMERSGASPVRLALPLPDAGYAEFDLVESPVLDAGLAAKFPSIRTYAGRGVQDPSATLRIDVTPLGFHAQILSPGGDFYIDPYQKQDTAHYVSYFRRDYGGEKSFRCDTHDADIAIQLEPRNDAKAVAGVPNTVGPALRTLRMAFIATRSYTNAFGGTVSSGLSGLTTLTNRLNGVYERDLGLRLVLVDGSDLLVFTDANPGPAALDPAPTGPDAIITTTINNTVGSSNYDLGHAVGGSGGGGAITPLGNVCTSQKGNGFTSLSPPRGDIFDIDFVAHELGHQLGANHTWFGCGGGGQWTQSSAMEPGSGSTIMGYAGICSDDLQPNSDAYFHARSFTQINARLGLDNTDVPPSCGSNSATGNNAPTVSAAADFSIPRGTPFQLTASGSDIDGDPVTYNWEQIDTGPSAASPSPTRANATSGPIFRSYVATLSPTRIFPSLPFVLNNANQPPNTYTWTPASGAAPFYTGEILTNVSRSLNFRVTARDNHAVGGGIALDEITLTSNANAGPFTVGNLAGPLTGGSSQAITWTVASTDTVLGTTLVNILVSLDGGYTWSTLAANTANDGNHTVTLPNTATTQARFRVEAANGSGVSAGNTWFDVTDSNVAINASGTAITLATSGFVATKQGSPAPAATAVATISGGTPPYTLSAAPYPSIPEIVVQDLSVAGGSVLASATADCLLAAPSTTTPYREYPVLLSVTDAASRSASTTFMIRVTNNDIPSIGTYADQSVGTGGNVSVSPSALPSDANSNLVGVSVSPTALPGGGTVSINPATAEVTIQTTPTTNLGQHKIRVAAADTCGATAVQQFNITVTTLDPVLQYNGVAVTTPSNAIIEPNECNTLSVTLGNIGGATASSISSTLSSSTPGVSIATADSPYGDIATNGSGSNTIAFEVGTEASVACGSTIDFSQTVTFNGPASPQVFNFSLPVGQPPGGHYTIASSSQAGSIAGGSLIAASQDDDAIFPISLPPGFAFSVYGTAVTALTGDTNGTLQFAATGSSTASNTALPAGFSAPTLLAFWDDLDMTSGVTTGGGVYTATNGSAPNRTFDIEWRARRWANSGSGAPTVQFMVRLHETSNLIEVFYSNVTGNGGGSGGASATVGIQRQSSGTDYDQFSFNTNALSAGQKLTYTLPPGICNVGPGTCFDPNAIFEDGFE
jgi:hypothetical protein